MELFKKKDKQAPVAVADKPEKKNLATMDVKDLFKSKKAKVEAAPADDLAIVPETPAKAPKEKKQSLATMDVKDLVKMVKNKPAKRGNINPKKRTMNFVHHKSNFNVVKMLPVALVIIIAAAAFVKIGFLDQLDKKTRAYGELASTQSLLKLMSIESVMPSNHLILCRPLFLLPSIFPSIRIFPNESFLPIWWPKYWSFSFSISPSNEYSGLISLKIDWFDLLAVQGTLKTLLQDHS